MANWFGGNNRLGGASPKPTPREVQRTVVMVLVAVLGAWIMSGVFVVKEGQQAVVKRLGRFHSFREAGVHWVLPFPIDQHEILSFAESGTLTIGEATPPVGSGLANSTTITADGRAVDVRLQVQYRMRDPGAYYQTQALDAEQLIRLAGSAAVREVVGGMPLAAVMHPGSNALAEQVQNRLQGKLDAAQAGVDISPMKMGKDTVRAPDALQAAFNEVATINQQHQQALQQANNQADKDDAQAKQEAAALIAQAQAYQSATVAEAQAESTRFAALLPAYKEAPQATRDRLYNDTMQQILGKTRKVIVDGASTQAIQLPPLQAASSASAAVAANKTQSPASAATPVSSAAAPSGANNPARNLRSRDPDMLRSR